MRLDDSPAIIVGGPHLLPEGWHLGIRPLLFYLRGGIVDVRAFVICFFFSLLSLFLSR